MLHPHTELSYVSPTVGLGVFATRRIPMGTVLWILDDLDQRLTPERARRLAPSLAPYLDRYAYRSNGRSVLCWDHARYVNHSCRPTCMGPPDQEFELAVRDVLPGEQLTDDYAALGLTKPFSCACEQPDCRGLITPKDAVTLAPTWDALVRAALAKAARVDQPLRSLFPGVVGAAETVGGGRAPSEWTAVTADASRVRG